MQSNILHLAWKNACFYIIFKHIFPIENINQSAGGCWIQMLYNHTYTYSNTDKYTTQMHVQMQADSNCSGMNRLLISDFGSSTRGERHNSYYANHPQYSAHLVVQSQFLNTMLGPQLLTIMVGPQLQLSGIEADNPTVCLPGPKVNSQLQNLQILRIIASGHDVIHTPAQFPIWDL